MTLGASLAKVAKCSHAARWGSYHRDEPPFHDREERGAMGARPKRRPGRPPHSDGVAEYGDDAEGRIVVVQWPRSHRGPIKIAWF